LKKEYQARGEELPLRDAEARRRKKNMEALAACGRTQAACAAPGEDFSSAVCAAAPAWSREALRVRERLFGAGCFAARGRLAALAVPNALKARRLAFKAVPPVL
jgi:hypothetical protein